MAGVLDGCPDVEALRVDTSSDWVRLGQARASVDSVDLHVHAGSHADARVLAGALGLVEDSAEHRVVENDYGLPPQEWRTWAGWVPDACREVPVRVRVVAADDAPAIDPAPDGAPVRVLDGAVA
ncbi:MAG: hypothetical protein ACRCY8_14750 [Dermatophilaceae bacterium]